MSGRRIVYIAYEEVVFKTPVIPTPAMHFECSNFVRYIFVLSGSATPEKSLVGITRISCFSDSFFSFQVNLLSKIGPTCLSTMRLISDLLVCYESMPLRKMGKRKWMLKKVIPNAIMYQCMWEGAGGIMHRHTHLVLHRKSRSQKNTNMSKIINSEPLKRKATELQTIIIAEIIYIVNYTIAFIQSVGFTYIHKR